MNLINMKIRLYLTSLFNIIDIISTLYLFLNGLGVEINPISNWLLQWPIVFILFKLVVTTIALMFIWWQREVKIVRITGWILFVEYGLVAIYYVLLFLFIL